MRRRATFNAARQRLQLVVPVNLTVVPITVLITVVSVPVMVTISIAPGVSVFRIDVSRISVVRVSRVWVRVSGVGVARVDVAWVIVGVSDAYGYPGYTEDVEAWVSRRR